jgi:hypothetical protein
MEQVLVGGEEKVIGITVSDGGDGGGEGEGL